jgi:hypothetical protein
MEAARKAAGGTGISEAKNGAGDEIRTHDIHLGKVTLYP